MLKLLALLSPEKRAVRFALAAVAGAVIAGGFATLFPQCLQRPEQVSDELYANWLSNVREAKPIYRHAFRTGFPLAALPVMGLIGAGIAIWRARRSPTLIGWACVGLFALFSALMLLWQVRSGPAAQVMAIPGVTALAWMVLPWLLGQRSIFVKVLATGAVFVLISGMFAGMLLRALPIDVPKPYVKRVNRATGLCLTMPAMTPLNRIPATTIFTFTDLGPRLIALTHHNAIAGPYHRNGDAILDVQHAFKGTPEEARAIMKRHGATMMLVCPNMAESTVYRDRAPGGFYDRLAHGETFEWLTPVPLPKGSPLRLFRIN